jgi:hypothetical protein
VNETLIEATIESDRIAPLAQGVLLGQGLSVVPNLHSGEACGSVASQLGIGVLLVSARRPRRTRRETAYFTHGLAKATRSSPVFGGSRI